MSHNSHGQRTAAQFGGRKPSFGKAQTGLPRARQFENHNYNAQPVMASAAANIAPTPWGGVYGGSAAPVQGMNGNTEFHDGYYYADGFGSLSSHITPVKGLRYIAGIIDSVVLIIGTFALMTITALNDVSHSAGDGAPGSLLLAIFTMWFVYGLAMEASSLKGTLGKVLTGTVIVNQDGNPMSFAQVFGRNCAKIISICVPFYMSYHMVLCTQNNQTLHDYIAKTHVYKKSDLNRLHGHVFD